MCLCFVPAAETGAAETETHYWYIALELKLGSLWYGQAGMGADAWYSHVEAVQMLLESD